jgi:hypothetical protein
MSDTALKRSQSLQPGCRERELELEIFKSSQEAGADQEKVG